MLQKIWKLVGILIGGIIILYIGNMMVVWIVNLIGDAHWFN